MARRDDGKDAALAASRTLNSDPQKVTDPAFAAGGFFDPADLLQVKYEMVRQVEVDGVPVSAAASAFGFARQSVYNARAALAAGGLAALIPAKPGPKGGHKLTGPVLDHLEALLEQDPRLTLRRAGRAGRAAVRHPGASPLGAPGAGTAVRRPRGRDRRTGGAQKRPARLTAAARRTSRDRCPGQAQIRRPGAMRPCARSRWPALAAAGGTSCPCWPPGEWHPGWPRSPPALRRRPPGSSDAAGRPVPVRPRPCPARYQHERR